MGLASRRVKDPLWLFILSRRPTPGVLVTFDNDMPTRHRGELLKRGSTLAVIDSKADRKGLSREQYTREVGTPLGAPRGRPGRWDALQLPHDRQNGDQAMTHFANPY